MENEKRSGKWRKIKSRACRHYRRIPDHLKKNPASSHPPFRYRFPDVCRCKLNCFEFFILDVYYLSR